MPTVPLLVMVPLAPSTMPLMTPLPTKVPLVAVPLVEPDVIAETIPEVPLKAPVLTPPLPAPEGLPLPATPLVRPPHAAIAKSTNADSDHRARLGVDGSNTGGFSH